MDYYNFVLVANVSELEIRQALDAEYLSNAYPVRLTKFDAASETPLFLLTTRMGMPLTTHEEVDKIAKAVAKHIDLNNIHWAHSIKKNEYEGTPIISAFYPNVQNIDDLKSLWKENFFGTVTSLYFRESYSGSQLNISVFCSAFDYEFKKFVQKTGGLPGGLDYVADIKDLEPIKS